MPPKGNVRELIGPAHSGWALLRAAFGACAGQPEMSEDDLLARVDAMVRALRRRLPRRSRPGDRLFALNTFLFHELGYSRLNNRHDPDGFLLCRVLDTRAGHPAALTVLYMAIGREIGLPMRAVAFPGILLVRTETANGSVILDPETGGSILSREDLELMLLQSFGGEQVSTKQLEKLLQGVDDRQVLIRLLTELERAYLHHQQADKALWAANYIVSLQPDSAAALRDRALLLERLECHQAAGLDYLRSLEHASQEEGREVLQHLQRLQRRDTILH